MLSSRTFSTGPYIVLVLAVAVSSCTNKPSFETPAVIIHAPTISSSAERSLPTSSEQSQSSTASIAPSVLIDVPFAPQAPYANWDPLHEEACEEMSLIMVHHFLSNTPLSLEDAEAEVQEMIAWQRAQGYADDVSVEDLGKIAQTLYGYRIRILKDVTPQMLREAVAAGHPVIIPAAGRLLHNPFFSGEGPFYHMLVVIGYTPKGFITHDPGTKRGERYFYSTDVLMNALHNWTGVKEETRKGAKVALIIER